MVLRPLKSYLPRSLFGRAALIVILPLLALQLVVAFVFIQRHYEGVTRQMTRNIAREIAVAQQVIDTSPTADIAQVRLFNLSKPLAIALELLDAADDRMVNRRNFFDLSGRALIQEMTRLLGGEVAVDLASNRRVVTVRLPTEKGILRVLIPRTRVTVSNPHQLLVLMVVASIILIGIAFLFLTMQVRPIRRLADAAEAFGKGRNLTFRPAGAEEVRRAGLAFIAMRGRLERLIETRTSMLAGVSHDLRTPLTRMKLSLALIDDPEAKAML
ncbi:MAG: histidine kinase dimerization/phospho-acceptor domain-containing protein, partial [Pseudomonadota bacterium]